MRYDPDIGIFGMDVSGKIGRKGARISQRKLKQSKVSRNHRLTIDDGRAYLRDQFKVEVV